MKNYGAMRFVAGVLKVLGWVIVALGILIFIAAILGHQNVPSSPYVNPATVAFVAFLVAGSIVLSGIFTIAAGELITAIADIAINSAQLAKIAVNSDKTVSFFERVAAKAAAQNPA